MPISSPRLAALAGSFAFIAATAACGSKRASDRFGQDAGGIDADAGPLADVTGESTHPDADPTLGGPCVDDAQCARPSIPCANFVCDKTVNRCRATPDDTRCDDGNYC